MFFNITQALNFTVHLFFNRFIGTFFFLSINLGLINRDTKMNRRNLNIQYRKRSLVGAIKRLRYIKTHRKNWEGIL